MTVGVDECAERVAWEEAKARERARKAAMTEGAGTKAGRVTGGEIKSEVSAVEMYETAKNKEVERIEREAAAKLAEEEEKRRPEDERLKRQQIAAEAKAREELLEKQRSEAEAARAREIAAKAAIQKKLDKERRERERAKEEEAKRNRAAKAATPRPPVLPKDDPKLAAETVETTVAALKEEEARSLYDVLRCPASASRAELKRSYLSLAKVYHPDALLQMGKANDAEAESRFVEISQAWKTLGDATSRRRYDRELQARGLSSAAGSIFENWVMGAAKAMDGALAQAESDLEGNGGEKQP